MWTGFQGAIFRISRKSLADSQTAVGYCEYSAFRAWIPLHGKSCQRSSGMHREIIHEFGDDFAYPISVRMKIPVF